MRRVVAVAALSLLALAACHKRPAQAPRTPAAPGSAPTASAGPAALPARAPGLWEQKVATRGMTQVSQVCLDKAVEQRFTWWGQHASQGACAQAQVTPRLGGGWDFASTCNLGEGGKASTRGSVTGDFAKSYRLTAQSTVSGASAPQMNGAHEMTLQAAWQGPCPAGMKPGDMILPGGMKINMLQMQAR